MSDYAEQIKSTASQLSQLIPKTIDVVVILGTGMSKISDALSLGQPSVAEFNVDSIACLKPLGAPGHAGIIRIIEFEDKTIAICSGRAHLYEGYTAREVCAQIYLLHQLGASRLLITNASGALNPNFRPGDIMLIDDHINLTGHNPIIGQDQAFGSIFADMSQAYSENLSQLALTSANQNSLRCHHGIYAGITGPSLETSAERRMLRTLGADAVGMSTVLEVIAANHCGMQVMGLSAISNMALGDEDQQADTVDDVISNAELAAGGMTKIISAVLSA